MARSLRPRKSLDYFAMAGLSENAGGDDNAEAGPSNSRIPYEEDVDYDGSDFAPDDAEGRGNNSIADDVRLDVDEQESPVQEKLVKPVSKSVNGNAIKTGASGQSKTIRKSKGKARAQEIKGGFASHSAASLPRGETAKMYSLPALSTNHRHRPMPIFLCSGRAERLASCPTLFGQPDIMTTKNFTFDLGVTDRVSKAWGYNIGAGPIWELMEDRQFFKESSRDVDDEEKECHRRPLVYRNVLVKDGWKILREQDALAYLPTDDIVSEDGTLKPAPPLQCYFGPFGKQTQVHMNIFDSLQISKYFPETRSYVLNAGGPVWGLDWCPMHPNERLKRGNKRYLAVAPFPSRSHTSKIGAIRPRPAPACIQIWTLRFDEGIQSQHENNQLGGEDTGEMACEMVLCLEGGAAHDIKWCPLPAHDELDHPHSRTTPRKLGILAGTFEDGSLSIYAVPDPMDLNHARHDPSRPLFVRLSEPLVRFEHETASCWSLDWANSERIAVGCTNGCIAVYDIALALRGGDGPSTFPTHYIPVHQSAVRAVTWVRLPPVSASGQSMTNEDPTIIASGGYDGLECLTDIRELNGNIMNRTRDVINSITYAPYASGVITADHENTVKLYSVASQSLGRGHMLLEPAGPVWSVATSDYHPQLAVGSSDGICTTTNTLRSTRRGGSVPFFAHKIYQLDYSRKTGEFRMLEHFLPQEVQEKQSTTKSKKQKSQSQENMPSHISSTGVWPPEVGVQRVAWNNGNGLSGAPLLASATGSGLCRVDWLLGRWRRDRVPYRSIENIRKETDEGMDESLSE